MRITTILTVVAFAVAAADACTSRQPERIMEQGPITSDECVEDKDCPRNTWCFPDQKCRDPCTDPHECGKNQQCVTHYDVPRCVCLPGFFGDGYEGCMYTSDADYCRGTGGRYIEGTGCDIQPFLKVQRPVFKTICPPTVTCIKGRPRHVGK